MMLVHTHNSSPQHPQIGYVLRVDKGRTFMPEPGPLLDALRALENEMWAFPITDTRDGAHHLNTAHTCPSPPPQQCTAVWPMWSTSWCRCSPAPTSTSTPFTLCPTPGYNPSCSNAAATPPSWTHHFPHPMSLSHCNVTTLTLGQVLQPCAWRSSQKAGYFAVPVPSSPQTCISNDACLASPSTSSTSSTWYGLHHG